MLDLENIFSIFMHITSLDISLLNNNLVTETNRVFADITISEKLSGKTVFFETEWTIWELTAASLECQKPTRPDKQFTMQSIYFSTSV